MPITRMPPKTPPVETKRVQVKSGCTVYIGGGTHPFHAGDEFDLPMEEAERMIEQGHVVDPSAAPAPIGVSVLAAVDHEAPAG